MKKMLLPVCALSVVLLLGAACQNTVNTVENNDKSMDVDRVGQLKFTTDSFCHDRLNIMIDRATAPSGLMMIQMTVRSERYGFFSELWSDIMGANPYYVSYKVDWLNAQGMEVKTAASTWLTESFYPGETKRLQAVAPNAQCKDFFVSFKEYTNN